MHRIQFPKRYDSANRILKSAVRGEGIDMRQGEGELDQTVRWGRENIHSQMHRYTHKCTRKCTHAHPGGTRMRGFPRAQVVRHHQGNGSQWTTDVKQIKKDSEFYFYSAHLDWKKSVLRIPLLYHFSGFLFLHLSNLWFARFQLCCFLLFKKI